MRHFANLDPSQYGYMYDHQKQSFKENLNLSSELPNIAQIRHNLDINRIYRWKLALYTPSTSLVACVLYMLNRYTIGMVRE